MCATRPNNNVALVIDGDVDWLPTESNSVIIVAVSMMFVCPVRSVGVL